MTPAEQRRADYVDREVLIAASSLALKEGLVNWCGIPDAMAIIRRAARNARLK
jgi:hypothetical protein